MSNSIFEEHATSTRMPPRRRGFFEETVLKLLTRRATVTQVDAISANFRLVTLKGAALKNVTWQPGQKIQVQLGGWVQRTYTPISWDGARGSVQVMMTLLSPGPGCAWVGSLKVGDECAISGPRRSLDLAALSGSVVLFGDETSVGLASALHSATLNTDKLHCLLEAHDVHETRDALRAVGVDQATVLQRAAADRHLLEMENQLSLIQAKSLQAHFVLTGKAQSIQALNLCLKRLGVPRSRVLTRPYWSLGKRGLE